MRANDEVSIDTALAAGADRQFIQVLEKILFLQSTLEDLIERFLGSKNEIEQQAGHKEEHDQQRGKYLREDASASGLNIAKGPGDERKPQCDQVGDTDRQEKLCAARRGFNQLDLSLQHPAARTRDL